MPTRVFTGDSVGSRIYSIGRIGYDTGTQDDGGVYTGTIRTERFSPAGEGGLVLYRRVQMRAWHTGSFNGTMRAFIDGIQTMVPDANYVFFIQSLSFS